MKNRKEINGQKNRNGFVALLKEEARNQKQDLMPVKRGLRREDRTGIGRAGEKGKAEGGPVSLSGPLDLIL